MNNIKLIKTSKTVELASPRMDEKEKQLKQAEIKINRQIKELNNMFPMLAKSQETIRDTMSATVYSNKDSNSKNEKEKQTERQMERNKQKDFKNDTFLRLDTIHNKTKKGLKQKVRQLSS